MHKFEYAVYVSTCVYMCIYWIQWIRACCTYRCIWCIFFDSCYLDTLYMYIIYVLNVLLKPSRWHMYLY